MQEPTAVPEGAAERLRLHACERYLRWSIAKLQAWDSDVEPAGADLILLSIFARSTRTYEAVVRWLGQRLFSEQGLMLNRSLFEDMVDIHWVSLNPDLAVTRLAQHDKYSRLLRADVQRRWPEIFENKPPKIKVTNEERKELKGLYGGSGSKSWTGEPNIEDRLESIMVCWTAPAAQRELRFRYEWVQKLNNETLHLSAFSMGRLVHPTADEDEGTVEWRFGSTPEWLTQALDGALWTYAQTSGLITDRFGLATEQEKTEAFEMALRDFAQAAVWARTGRFEPPPPREEYLHPPVVGSTD